MKRLIPVQVLAACIALLTSSCITIKTTLTPDQRPTTPLPLSADVVKNTKVVLVILENRDAKTVEDAFTTEDDTKALLFLKALKTEGAYLSNYHAVAHPSQPNYVALVSGSFQGINHGDEPATVDRDYLGKQLGDSWAVYAEGYPTGSCYTGKQSGRYVRKHVPYLSFEQIENDRALCQEHIVGFPADFGAAYANGKLPRFVLVIPNLDHDAHDGSLVDADRWLNANFGPLLDNPRFRREVLLIVTFDEDAAHFSRKGNRVSTILWGAHVKNGADTYAYYSHYDLLHTIEAYLGADFLSSENKDAKIIGGVWK